MSSGETFHRHTNVLSVRIAATCPNCGHFPEKDKQHGQITLQFVK